MHVVQCVCVPDLLEMHSGTGSNELPRSGSPLGPGCLAVFSTHDCETLYANVLLMRALLDCQNSD